jgi:hypothetical protein
MVYDGNGAVLGEIGKFYVKDEVVKFKKYVN